MTQVTDQQAYAALRAVGFDRDAAITMVAIMHPESGGWIEAYANRRTNPVPGYGPEESVGLWQINLMAHPQYDGERLATDVMYAAQAAYDVSGGGTNFRPWTAYLKGAYKGFLAGATAAANEVDQTGNAADVIASIPMGKGPGADRGGGGGDPTFGAGAGSDGTVTAANAAAPAIDPNTGISTDPAVVTFLQAIARDPDGLVRARFPSYALYLQDPELGPILRQAALENWDALRLQQAVQNTQWWHETSSAQRTWDNLVATDPATAQSQREQKLLQVSQEFSQIGFTPDPATLAKIVDDSLRHGWDANRITQAIIGTLPDTAAGLNPGDIQATIGQLTMAASDYYMPLSEDTAYDWAKRISAGTLSQPAAVEMLRSWAKTNYAWLAPQIDQGLTVKDFFAPYQQQVATIMGVTPDSIDIQNDPVWNQLTRVDDGDGTIRTPTFADAQRLARSQPGYAGTVDAQNRGASAVASMRRIFQGA